jgi:hypothetical protein
LTAAGEISKSRYAANFALKSGAVLISRAVERNRLDSFRHTADSEIRCGDRELREKFCSEAERILNSGTDRYRYTLISRRENTDGDSLRFSADYCGGQRGTEFVINVRSNADIELDFSEVLDTNSPTDLLCGRICAVSSPMIYGRINDLYDIGVLATLYSFRYSDAVSGLCAASLTNMLVPDNLETVARACAEFTGTDFKPAFTDLIYLVQRFLYPFYIDMLKYDCDTGCLLETLYDFCCSDNDTSKLDIMAERFGLKDKLDSLLNELR